MFIHLTCIICCRCSNFKEYTKKLILPIEIANLEVSETYVEYDITSIKIKLQSIKEEQFCFIENDQDIHLNNYRWSIFLIYQEFRD